MEFFRNIGSILAGMILLAAPLSVAGIAAAADNAAPAAAGVSSAAGETFTNDGSTYRWQPDLRAVFRGNEGVALRLEGRSPAATGDAMTVKEILGEKGRYHIYRPLPAAPAGSAIRGVMQNSRDIPTFPIVLNTTTRQFGVVTDTLMLQLKDPSQAGDIAGEYGLTLSFTSEPIRTAFYRIATGTDIRDLRARLLNDPRVERVTLDIIDRIRRPR